MMVFLYHDLRAEECSRRISPPGENMLRASQTRHIPHTRVFYVFLAANNTIQIKITRKIYQCDLHAVMQTAVDCLAWMRQKELLAVHMACHKCQGPVEKSEYTDVLLTKWPRPKNCRIITSIRKGSFFQSAHLPLRMLQGCPQDVKLQDWDGQPYDRDVPFLQTLKTEMRPRRWTLKTETRRSTFKTETFQKTYRDRSVIV